jgi:hypothetical protein
VSSISGSRRWCSNSSRKVHSTISSRWCSNSSRCTVPSVAGGAVCQVVPQCVDSMW